MGTDAVQALLDALQANPADVDLRRRAAEALDAAGRPADAARTLAPFVNLTGHDDDAGLPCLCKHCLPAAGPTAEAGGMRFARSFAVNGDRVLHFWLPAALRGDRRPIRASVTAAMRARAAALRARRAS